MADGDVTAVRRPGCGHAELRRVGGRTAVVRLEADSPLRLLAPRQRSAAAWVVAGSYGGGLVSGDRLDVTLRCGDVTTVVLGTQASTKVYRAAGGPAGSDVPPGRDAPAAKQPPTARSLAEQSLAATVGESAVLLSWPDPVTCFAGSRYRQAQRFELAATASLLAVDWLTSGRMARDERWAFDRYESRTTIATASRPVVRDALRLDPADGPLDAPARTGGFGCLGTAWLVGPAFAPAACGLLDRLGRSPIDPRRDVQFAVSPIGGGGSDSDGGGAVLRFAGRSTESAWRWLREQLAGAVAVVGIDPWTRRG